MKKQIKVFPKWSQINPPGVIIDSYEKNNVQGEDVKMLTRLERLTEVILKGIHYVGMAFVILMMLLTTAHAAGRYVFGLPVPGLVELSSYMMVTMIFLTAPYTALVKGHIAIGVIVDRFSTKAQAVIDLLIDTLCLALSVLAACQTYIRGAYIMEEGQVSTILSIPNAPFIFLVGVGWILFSLAILIHIINSIFKLVKK